MNPFSIRASSKECRWAAALGRCAGLIALLGAADLSAQTSTSPANTGLWMGDVVLHSVTHARTGAIEGTPTRAQLRLLLHVDANGKARLLKEVILAQPVVSVPGGTNVLLFTEAARMAGRPVATDATQGGALKAQRFATAAYDFADTDGTSDNALELAGSLGAGATLQVTNRLSGAHPTNPFRHKYHPDHANEGPAAFEIARAIRMGFLAEPRIENGLVLIDGTYEETIKGLHRADLVAQGFVRLTRITPADALNP
jgi:hypothetical protein